MALLAQQLCILKKTTIAFRLASICFLIQRKLNVTGQTIIRQRPEASFAILVARQTDTLVQISAFLCLATFGLRIKKHFWSTAEAVVRKRAITLKARLVAISTNPGPGNYVVEKITVKDALLSALDHQS